jgi:hypothetical protein
MRKARIIKITPEFDENVRSRNLFRVTYRGWDGQEWFGDNTWEDVRLQKICERLIDAGFKEEDLREFEEAVRELVDCEREYQD